MTEIQDKPPNPGSDEAIKLGCRCPVWDNARGLGIGRDGEAFGWWITTSCPLHGVGVPVEEEEVGS